VPQLMSSEHGTARSRQRHTHDTVAVGVARPSLPSQVALDWSSLHGIALSTCAETTTAGTNRHRANICCSVVDFLLRRKPVDVRCVVVFRKPSVCNLALRFSWDAIVRMPLRNIRNATVGGPLNPRGLLCGGSCLNTSALPMHDHKEHNHNNGNDQHQQPGDHCHGDHPRRFARRCRRPFCCRSGRNRRAFRRAFRRAECAAFADAGKRSLLDLVDRSFGDRRTRQACCSGRRTWSATRSIRASRFSGLGRKATAEVRTLRN
jgi:hypothetical protein